MVRAVSSYFRPEWADTSSAGGPRPPVPPPLISESPEWGDTDRAASPTSSCRIGPLGPSDSGELRKIAITEPQQFARRKSKRPLEGFVFIAWLGLFRYKHVFGIGVHVYHYFPVAAFALRQFDLHGLTKRDSGNTASISKGTDGGFGPTFRYPAFPVSWPFK
jgi:hypothetical protein